MTFTDALNGMEHAAGAIRQQTGKTHAGYFGKGFVAIAKNGTVYSVANLDGGNE